MYVRSVGPSAGRSVRVGSDQVGGRVGSGLGGWLKVAGWRAGGLPPDWLGGCVVCILSTSGLGPHDCAKTGGFISSVHKGVTTPVSSCTYHQNQEQAGRVAGRNT